MEIDRQRLLDSYGAMSTDELLELHGGGTLTDAAYSALERILGERGIEVPARRVRSEVKPERTAFTEFMDQHWRGERSLGSAYWLIGIIGSLTVIILSGVVRVLGLTAVASSLSVEPNARTVYLLGIFGSPVTVYLIFAWVSIWRCAWNTPWPVFGYLARFIVIISALRYISLFVFQLRVL